MSLIMSGMPYSNLVKAATISNGILKFKESEVLDFINTFDQNRSKISIVKFVPASGAATRMFKFLHQFLNNYKHLDLYPV